MIWKTPPSTALGIALLATGSCPDVHRRAEVVAPEPEVAAAEAPSEDPSTWATPPVTAEIARSIEAALPVLLADGDAWMEGRAPFQDGDGCVSCHQVPYGVWALSAAEDKGIVADAAARKGARFAGSTYG